MSRALRRVQKPEQETEVRRHETGISRGRVREDNEEGRREFMKKRRRSCRWFHLGADIFTWFVAVVIVNLWRMLLCLETLVWGRLAGGGRGKKINFWKDFSWWSIS